MAKSMSYSLFTAAGIITLQLLRRKAYRNSLVVEESAIDFISQLPNEIVISIISRLSNKEAARTCVLSKRWKNLPIFAPDIDFVCPDGGTISPYFHRFIGFRDSIPRYLQTGQDGIISTYFHRFLEFIPGYFEIPRDFDPPYLYGVDLFLYKRLHLGFLIGPDLDRQFINRVDLYLWQRLRLRSMIRSFSFTCCFMANFQDRLKNWISYLGKLDVRRLRFDFRRNKCHSHVNFPATFIFPLDLVSSTCCPPLEFLSLYNCRLQNPKYNSCHSITALHLNRVSCGFDGLLSDFLSLELLSLEECMLPTKLSISGRNLRLKVVQLLWNENLEELDIHDSGRLIELDCCSAHHINFSFNYVPNLARVRLDMYPYNVMPYVHYFLATDSPRIECLIFHVRSESYQERSEFAIINQFNYLKTLYLILDASTAFYLFEIATMLAICPVLEEFHLAKQETEFRCWSERRAVGKLGLLTHLKRVEINGFFGTKDEIDFALYIIRSAPVLEIMHISRNSKFYDTKRKWEEIERPIWTQDTHRTIYEQLKGEKALSKNAKVILNWHTTGNKSV